MLLLLAVTDLQTIAAITPQIAIGLDTSTTAVSYSFAAYSMAAVVAALLLRNYSNRFGKTRSLSLIAMLYAVSCAFAAVAPNIFIFLVSRSISGIAGGFISALVITALAQVTAYEKRGVNMNFISFSYFMAPMLGVPLSAFLTDYYGWRIVFVITGGLVFFTGILISIFPIGKKSIKNRIVSPRPNANFSKSLRMGIISAFFVSGSVVGFTAFVGTWLYDSWQANAKQVGLIYALLNFGALIGGISGGFLADKFGKRPVALHPGLLMAFCLFALPLMIWENAILVLLFTVAFAGALRVAPLQALLTELARPNEIASYIATRNIASQIGIGFSILVCGQLYLSFGLEGVSIACAVLSMGSWITIKAIVEPDEICKPIMTKAVYD